MDPAAPHLQTFWVRRQSLGPGFPPTSEALDHPNGLLAAGGDLEPGTLVNAYRRGIFPWFSAGEPILWWSPNPRTVLQPAGIHISRSLKRTLRRAAFRVTCNQAFAEVLDACAGPRVGSEGTWITPEMQAAYRLLHAHQIAHSVEVWHDDVLVGGLYGVALGQIFFGESMFSRRDDASKVALANLGYNLERWGFELIDCQAESDHLLRMGATRMSRTEFEQSLSVYIPATLQQPWSAFRADDWAAYLAPVAGGRAAYGAGALQSAQSGPSQSESSQSSPPKATCDAAPQTPDAARREDPS